MRKTPKLFNKNTKGAYEMKREKTYESSTPKKKNGPSHVKCPYLSTNSGKICVRMVDAGLDGKLSSFDIQHFCNGNPVYCYYFRFDGKKE